MSLQMVQEIELWMHLDLGESPAGVWLLKLSLVVLLCIEFFIIFSFKALEVLLARLCKLEPHLALLGGGEQVLDLDEMGERLADLSVLEGHLLVLRSQSLRVPSGDEGVEGVSMVKIAVRAHRAG